MHCGDQRHLGLCLGYVPALAYGSCRVSDQGTTLRASDLHNARATILNPFIKCQDQIFNPVSVDLSLLWDTNQSGFTQSLDAPIRENAVEVVISLISRIYWPIHDDVIEWRHIRVTDPLCREFISHRWNSPHTGQWHEASMFSSICAWTNGWVNNRDDDTDLRSHRTLYDVTLMNIPVE